MPYSVLWALKKKMNEEELALFAQKYSRFFDISNPTQPRARVNKKQHLYNENAAGEIYGTKVKEEEVWATIDTLRSGLFAVFGDYEQTMYYGKDGEYPRQRLQIKTWVILDGKSCERDILIAEDGMARPLILMQNKESIPYSRYFSRGRISPFGVEV
jgi:hypothetical protein